MPAALLYNSLDPIIHRVLKLARPIADLAGSEAIQAAHSDETIQQCLFAGAKESLWLFERVLPESAADEPPAVRRHHLE